MAVVQVSVLGPIRVDGGRVALSPRDRVVLAALAARLGEDLRAEEIADALWGDAPPASWSKVVPGCIMRLRRALGASAIQTTHVGYRLVPEHIDSDARTFEQMVTRGHELALLGEEDRSAHMFEGALALWRGKPFAELEDWNPARIAAGRLDELRLETEEALLSARLQAGPVWEVVGAAHGRVAEAPLRERRWALLAEAQYRDGCRGDALATLRRARRMLANELGLDPGPDLVALEHAILHEDASLSTGVTYREPSTQCPYFGLVAADVEDAELFFGREEDLATCMRSLAETGVLVVAGPSGIGKSSLARAGLASTLRRNGRTVVVMAPGARPMTALAEVPDSDHLGALVVDQCEEALLLCDDEGEQRRFFAALASYAERGLLVVTMRADRLGEIAGFPEFARVVERNLYLLGPLSDAGLRAVIERPARQAGLLLEPGLVDLLVRDAAGEPGALPLLSHALRQTWLRREGRTMTVDGYAATGGIRGAIAQSAEEVYHDLPASGRVGLRDLMLRLIEPTPDGEPVRLRVPRKLVTTESADDRLVEQLVDARLLTSDAGVVEMAHESLARNWPRLRIWLDEDVEGQRILRHLSLSAASWQAMDRPETELYRGARLAGALAWRDAGGRHLTAVERDFLDASATREQVELAAARAQASRDRRTVGRLRRLTAGIAVLAVLAASAWAVAAVQRDRAEERSTVAEARRVAARALVERPYDRSLLLAVEAVRLWDSPETRGNLLATIDRSPKASSIVRTDGAGLLELDVDTYGRRAVVLDNLEAVSVLDLEDRRRVARLSTPGRSYQAPTLSPDATRVAAAWVNVDCWAGNCTDFGLGLFDAQDLRAAGPSFEGFGSPIAGIAFAPQGDRLAAVAPLPWNDGTGNVVIWRVDRPEEPIVRIDMGEVGVNPLVTPERTVQGWLRFSPDGQRLLVSGAGPTVVFDATTGRALRSLGGKGALGLSPDGTTIALAASGNVVELVDTTTGARTARLVGHSMPVLAVAFSEDGHQVATCSTDQTAVVWDARSGERLDVLQGHVGSVHGVDVAADGTVHTAGADGSVFRWDLRHGTGLSRVVGGIREVGSEAPTTPWSSTGSTVLLSAEDDDWVFVDMSKGGHGRARIPNDPEFPWVGAAFHPDGGQVAVVRASGSVSLVDANTGAVLAEHRSYTGNEGAIAYTPDGVTIVVADRYGMVTALDAATLEPVGEPLRVGGAPVGIRATHGGIVAVSSSISQDVTTPTAVTFADIDEGRVVRSQDVPAWAVRANFSPDGRFYGYGGFDGGVGVVDVATGEIVTASEPLHDGPVSWVTFSPDSETLISTGFDGQVVLSDATDAVPFARLGSGRPGRESTATFLADGHTVRVVYSDGLAVEFEADPEAWLTHACTVAGRNLSPTEWQDAFGGRPYEPACPESVTVS